MILSLFLILNVSAREAIEPGYYVGTAGAPIAFVRVHWDDVRARAMFVLDGPRPTLGRGRAVEELGSELDLMGLTRLERRDRGYFIGRELLIPVSAREFYVRFKAYLAARGSLALNVPFDESVEAETARWQRANEMCGQFFGVLCGQTGLRMRTGEPIELEVPNVRRAAAVP